MRIDAILKIELVITLNQSQYELLKGETINAMERYVRIYVKEQIKQLKKELT